MDVVHKDVVNRSCLAIGQHNSPADQLLLGSMEFSKYIQGAPAARIQTFHPDATIIITRPFLAPSELSIRLHFCNFIAKLVHLNSCGCRRECKNPVLN